MAGLWLFFMALTVVYLLPGPDMILLLQTGARQGKGAALATAVGLGIARGCHVALAALGLATLFKAAPWTFDIVRLAGAAYLLWLGIQCLRTTMLPDLNDADPPAKNLVCAQLSSAVCSPICLIPKRCCSARSCCRNSSILMPARYSHSLRPWA